MELIQRRSPRAFSGERASGLREIYSATRGTLGIISLEKVISDNKRYNTKAFVLVSRGDGVSEVDQTNSVFYNRQLISTVFNLAKIRTEDGYLVEAASSFEHPIEQAEIIKLLNGKYRCDFTDDDIVVTYINGNYYSIESLPNSLGYIGKATLAVGIAEEIPLIPTEHALFSSEQSMLSKTIQLNGRAYPITSPQLFTTENVIFHEFNKVDGDKLTYFLNLNEISLTATTTVDISSRPANTNLNETARPSNGSFILSEFIRASTEVPTSMVDIGTELRFTSWLDSIDKIDAIFDVRINGTYITLKDISLGLSEVVDLDTADNVLLLSNKTYQPVEIYLRAKTISLPALEDSRFTFLRFDTQPGLLSGYEVYGYRLAALVKPLENLRVRHWLPTEAQYNSLLTRLAQVIGTPPTVVMEEGTIVEIQSLNLDHDDYNTYAENIAIEGNAKISDASISRSGLKFLDVFAIDQEQWEILQATDLNANLIQVTRTNQGFVESTNQLTVNQLLARGFYDSEFELFIFAFNCIDDWEGVTRFAYSAGILFLPTVINLTTRRDLTRLYLPAVNVLEQGEWDVIRAAKPTWGSAYGPNAFTGTPTLVGYNDANKKFEFTYNVVPTLDEIAVGSIEVGFLAELKFHKDIKPILDRAMQRYSGLDEGRIFIKLASNTSPALMDVYVLTYGEYRTKGFQDFHFDAETGTYSLVVRCKTRIAINPNFNLGNAANVIDRVDNVGQLHLSFDADSIYGTLFEGGDNIDYRNVVNNISFNSPNLASPVVQIAANQAELLANPLIQAKIAAQQPNDVNANGVGDYVVLEQSLTNLKVNIKRIPNVKSFWVVMECLLTAQQYANMDNFTIAVNEGMVIDGATFKARLAVIGGKYYYLYQANANSSFIDELSIVTDCDGGQLVYVPETSVVTIDITVIEPPLSLFMLVDENADDISQQALLEHNIDPGYTPPNIPTNSPFDAFKAPLTPIMGLAFSDVFGKMTIDGVVSDIDEATLVGVEFKLYITESDLAEKPDNDDVVANIRKVGTSWNLDLPRSLFKRQTYIKDGDVYLYLIFKLAEVGGFNGEYIIDVDWDGLGSDDNYVINGVDHNSFYKQTLPFTLDLNAQFLPRDLASPTFGWTTLSKQQGFYARLLTGDIIVPGYNTSNLIPADLVSFTKTSSEIASVSAILPDNKGWAAIWFAESDMNDESYALLETASIKWSDNGSPWMNVTPAPFKNSFIKIDGRYYWPRPYILREDHQNQAYQIDLDAAGKKYKVMTSRLEMFVTAQQQQLSPSFGWATNQTALLSALKSGAMVYGPFDVAEVVDVNRVTYGSVTATEFNAEVMKSDGRVLVAFLEFLGSQEQFDLLNSATTLTTRVEGQQEMTLSWEQLQAKLVTYGGKHYLPMIYNESTGLKNESFKLDVDGVGKLYLPSSKDLSTSLQWFDPSASPKLIVAPNQADLLTAAKLGVITHPELIPTELAETAGVVYSISETSMTATYTGATAKRVPLFAELVASTTEFDKLGPNTKITTYDSEGIPQVVPWTTFAANIINYDNKRYLLIGPGITEGETGFHYIIDTDGDALRYTPTTSIVTADVEFIQSIASPTMKVADNQAELLGAVLAGQINTGKPASSYVTVDDVKYDSVTDTTLNAEVITGSNLILPVFNELMISTTDYAKLNASSTVKLNYNGTEVTLNGNVLKTSLLTHNDKYYLLTEMVKATPTYALSLALDLDGPARLYLETTSSTGYNTTWVTPKASPKLTYATNQAELLNRLKTGEIPFEDVFPADVGFTVDQIVDLEHVEYVTLEDTTLAANVRRINDDVRVFITFAKVDITTAEFENIPAAGTVSIDGTPMPLDEFLAKVFNVRGAYYMVHAFQYTDQPNSNFHSLITIDYDGVDPYYEETTSTIDLITNYLDQLESPIFTVAQNIFSVNNALLSGEIVVPAYGPIDTWIESQDMELVSISTSSLTALVKPSSPDRVKALVTLKVSLTDEDYEVLGNDTTLSISNAEEVQVIDTTGIKDVIYAYDDGTGTGKQYYITFMLEKEKAQSMKNTVFLIDVDGANPVYMPKTSLIDVDLTWVDDISCEDAYTTTQCLQLIGQFKIKVDGEFINDGIAMDWNQIQDFFDDGPYTGITIDNCLDISCAGAPNQTQCVNLTGNWDVYVDENQIAINASSDDLPSLFDEFGNGVQMIECPPDVIATPHAAVLGLMVNGNGDIDTNINLVNLGEMDYQSVANHMVERGIIVIPMIKVDCEPTSLSWDIPADARMARNNDPNLSVYAGWIDDSIQGEGTQTFTINDVTVEIPYNMVISRTHGQRESTYYLFGTDAYGLQGVVSINAVEGGDPWYVHHIDLSGHSKMNGMPNYEDMPANITIAKLPSVITDHFTETDVDYFAEIFGDEVHVIHSCSRFTNPPM